MTMDIKEFRSRLSNRDITRRDMHKVLASVGVGTVAMHYGPNGAMAENAVDSELTVFTWSGYDIPELHPKYTEQHGTSPQ
jgi:spermidine/putrescine transport system substrate-binding protein